MKEYKHKTKKHRETIKCDGKYIYLNGYKIEATLNTYYWEEIKPTEKKYRILKRYFDKITVVERLSDGLVFKIGDRVSYSDNIKYDFNIKCFEIMIDGDIKLHSVDGHYCLLITTNPTIKRKKITTVDGLDIYWGEECWAISKTELNSLGKVNWDNPHPYDHALYFTSERTAKEYVILNESCLSLTEVGEFYQKLLNFSNGNSKGLRALVEDKLKL